MRPMPTYSFYLYGKTSLYGFILLIIIGFKDKSFVAKSNIKSVTL